MKMIVVLVALLVVAVPASAQLSLSMSGDLCPGDTVTASVSGGGSDLLTFLAAATSQGSTTLLGGPFGVTIDLSAPFIILPIGTTDSNGDVSQSAAFPANLPPSVLPNELHFQAATLAFSFGGGFPMTIETSNVATITSACP